MNCMVSHIINRRTVSTFHNEVNLEMSVTRHCVCLLLSQTHTQRLHVFYMMLVVQQARERHTHTAAS